MPEINKLKELKERSSKINKKLTQALSIRKRLIKRIYESCDILRREPYNEKARWHLIRDLKHEEHFLKIIEGGSEEGISILRATLKEINKVEVALYSKNRIKESILTLIDSMRFISKKIKTINKRVRRGEKLEKKGYSSHHLEKFVRTLKEEERIDEELGKRLEGQLERIKPGVFILAKELKIDNRILIGMATGTSTYLLSLYPMIRGALRGIEKGTISGDEASINLLVISIIIFTSSFLVGLVKYEKIESLLEQDWGF